MKKLIAVLVCVALMLIGCGEKNEQKTNKKESWKFQRASAEVAPYAERAIEIIDGYLNFKTSIEETATSFEELYDRIKFLDISYLNEAYNDADYQINHCITWLWLDADELTDKQFRMYRDMLAFQLGENVSGNTYSAERQNTTHDVYYGADYIGDYKAISNSYSYYESDTAIMAMVRFDWMNGVYPTDLEKIASDIIAMAKDVEKSFSISIDYQCYGQSAFFAFAEIDSTGVEYQFVPYGDEGKDPPAITLKQLEKQLEIAEESCGLLKKDGDLSLDERVHSAIESSFDDEVRKFPDEASDDHIPEYGEVVPKEVFSSTGEENGLIGNLYMIFGTVEEYIENPDGNPFFIRVSTSNGDVIIADPVEMLRNDKESNTMLSDAGLDKMREYFPLPIAGEFCVFYAEYQGMSGVYDSPFFVYGTSSYMLDTVVEIAMMGDEYTID